MITNFFLFFVNIKNYKPHIVLLEGNINTKIGLQSSKNIFHHLENLFRF